MLSFGILVSHELLALIVNAGEKEKDVLVTTRILAIENKFIGYARMRRTFAAQWKPLEKVFGRS